MKRASLALVFAVLVSACTLGGAVKSPPSVQNPITGGAIATTSLDAPAAVAAPTPAPTGPVPLATLQTQAEFKAASAAAAAAEEPAPEAEKPVVAPHEMLPQEIACLKSSGVWAGAKDGLMRCLKMTKDAGKRCTNGSQCEGYCLARSNTCAPATPLFGCNDILLDNGVRATQCID